MKIYKLTGDARGYDTYDSCVVAALSENDARKIHPSKFTTGEDWVKDMWRSGDWASRLDAVDVKYLGEAKKGTDAGVICSSFNAG